MKPYVPIRCTLILLITVLSAFPIVAFSKEESESPKKIPHESSMYYTVKKGDTLWDLSRRFADTPWQWPDLWRKNGQITNPHRIFPGEKILLYRNNGINTVKSPEVKQPSPPVVASTPPQPPAPPAPKPFYLYRSINQVGFLRKSALPPSGHVFSVRGDKALISSGDIIYVKSAKGKTLSPGQQYMVYRLRPTSSDKKKSALMGKQHYILGIIEIREKMPDFATAYVQRSFRSIKAGDLLAPYSPRSPKIFITPSKTDLIGRILMAEEHQSFFGSDTIAFIDKGTANGIRIGQKYNVFYEEKIAAGDPKNKTIVKHPVDYATFLVLSAEADTASVLIISAKKSINPGARFRTPR